MGKPLKAYQIHQTKPEQSSNFENIYKALQPNIEIFNKYRFLKKTRVNKVHSIEKYGQILKYINRGFLLFKIESTFIYPAKGLRWIFHFKDFNISTIE